MTALETAANVKAHVLGKPTRKFFETTLESLTSDGIEREMWVNTHPGHGDAASRSIVIIGDDVVNDLGEGAVELNLRRVLGESMRYGGTVIYHNCQCGRGNIARATRIGVEHLTRGQKHTIRLLILCMPRWVIPRERWRVVASCWH